MLNFSNNNKKNELKESKKRYGRKVDEQGRYVEVLEHIRGNAAIGEQVHSARTFKTDKPMTFEEMKLHWDEMNREAKEWLNNNPGQSANFITSQDTNGNAIIQVVPAKDLIFSGSNLVAIYDGNGNQIVGKENIIKEVQRRRMQRDKWIKEGKLENIFDEIHHTDDGWTSNVRFTAYPEQLHPNEVKAESERLLRIAEGRSENDKRKNRFLGDGVDSDTEETSEVLADNKKPKIEAKGNTTPMDIDQPETSTSKSQESSLIKASLLSDDEIKKASKEQLIDFKKRIEKELEIRRQVGANSSSSSQNFNYQVSTDELKDKLQKSEQLLSNCKNPSLDNKDNNGKTGIIVAIAGISALAIGGIALVKSKFSKNKKN